MYLAGNMGESLANESVEAATEDHRGRTTAAGVKVFVTGMSALAADQQMSGDRSVKIIEGAIFVVIITMLLLVYRSIITTILVLVMVVLGADLGARRRRVPGLSRADRALHVRHPVAGDAGGGHRPPTTRSS